MRIITILNFTDGTVHQLNLTSEEFNSEDLESIIEQNGFNLNNIEWMSHNDSRIYYFNTDLYYKTN